MEKTDEDQPPPQEQRIDRNWTELLQELRVTQTGVQILSGFLLTVPFSNRFVSLDHEQRTAYLLVLCGSVLTTAFVVAPVAFHRILFRHRKRPWLVNAAHGCALAGLFTFMLTTSGSLFLIFDVVVDRSAGYTVLAWSLGVFLVLWVLVSLVVLVLPRRTEDDEEGGHHAESSEPPAPETRS